MNETLKRAHQRVTEEKATQSELEVLIKWGEEEISEWLKFIEMCKEKIKP